MSFGKTQDRFCNKKKELQYNTLYNILSIVKKSLTTKYWN